MADQQGGVADQGGAAAPEQRYFCYQCDKDVAVEGVQGAMTCVECHGGFLEAIATVSPEFRPRRAPRQPAIPIDEAMEQLYPDQLAQMVQALMTVSRDFRVQPPLPPPTPEEGEVQQGGGGGERLGAYSDDGGYDSETGLRVELEGENGDGNDEEDEWEEADEEERVALAAVAREEVERGDGTREGPFSNFVRQIVQNLLERNVEIRFELPELPVVGNPGDYLDARGFEQFLQHLAETDNSNKGAPPASKSYVEGLKMVKVTQANIDSGEAVCAVCKDPLSLDEPVKQLPCLHVYHPDCILPWLSTRNSCPVCRYELPTDDPDYEEQKRNRRASESVGATSGDAATESSSSVEDAAGSSVSGGGAGDVCREEMETETETNVDNTPSEEGVRTGEAPTEGEAELKADEVQEIKPGGVEEGEAEAPTGLKADDVDVKEPGTIEDGASAANAGSVSRSWLIFAVGPLVSVLGLIVAGHLSGLLEGVQSRVFQQLLGSRSQG